LDDLDDEAPSSFYSHRGKRLSNPPHKRALTAFKAWLAELAQNAGDVAESRRRMKSPGGITLAKMRAKLGL
jgi:hypothetical protein